MFRYRHRRQPPIKAILMSELTLRHIIFEYNYRKKVFKNRKID